MHKSLKGKKLLILGGIRLQEGIVKNVQARGGKAIVIDYYDNFNDSPAKAIADEHYVISVTDVDAVVKFIKENNIDGVLMGYTDSMLPYYAEICEKSGLPCYGTKEQFITFTNKTLYKKLLKEYGVPVVDEYELADNFSENDTENIEYPVLVKPSDSSGSRGVRVCRNYSELKEGYEYAKKWSKCNEVIVEKYLTGDEIDCFWAFENGEPYLTALANRHTKSYYEGVNAMVVAYTYPSVYLSDYEKNIAPKAKKMFKDLGLKEGCLFMQCFIDGGIAKCYDIGFRLTGSMENVILRKVCGFDPMEMMIDYAIFGSSGEQLKSKVDPHCGNLYGWNISFLMKPGKIAKIEGYEEVLKSTGVINAFLDKAVGDEILESEKGQLKQMVLRVLGCSDSKENIKRDMQKVFEIFKVYDENGNNLLMPPVDISEYYDLID